MGGKLLGLVLLVQGAILHGFSLDNHVLTMEKVDVTSSSDEYTLDDAEGRVFDGIGGLSGGGATSRLLVNYPKALQEQIFDYLFKPGFGASLQILKVEIGGDAQSTDGSEPSHMHTENETSNFTRGYEWWVMKEAKARNPDIIFVGLPWAWPGWLGEGYSWPYTNNTKTAKYITSWIKGMKSTHDLTIKYVGIWNERPYDVEYIKVLRQVLDSEGLADVGIIAPDGSWAIAGKMLKDQDLMKSIQVIGAHYPGTTSTDDCEKTGKTLWSSEDYSTYNDNIGAGCWARILNQNYVNGNMTSTIAWNLIASYYDALPYGRCSLMTANEPWSGHYDVTNVIWVTAHTTQFTQPGWRYLKASSHLLNGGSFVALTDPKHSQLTIVIETMSHTNSICIRPYLPPFKVETQNVTFVLGGTFKNLVSKFYMWKTQLGKFTSDDQVFSGSQIEVNNGRVTVLIEPDQVITLTTIATGMKGSHLKPPSSAPFPIPYEDDFDKEIGFSEANNFADQSGVFEFFYNDSSKDGHHKTMRQVVPLRPVVSCDDVDSPITVIGDYSWSQVNVTVDVKLENSPGVFLAARVDGNGCKLMAARGLFLWLYSDFSWQLTTYLEYGEKKSFKCHPGSDCWRDVTVNKSGWNKLSLSVSNTTVFCYLNSVQVLRKTLHELPYVPDNGWVAFGVKTYDYAQFDNFSIKKPTE